MMQNVKVENTRILRYVYETEINLRHFVILTLLVTNFCSIKITGSSNQFKKLNAAGKKIQINPL